MFYCYFLKKTFNLKEKTFRKFYSTLFKYHANKYSKQNESNQIALVSCSTFNLKTHRDVNMDGLIRNALADSSNIILEEENSNQVNQKLFNLNKSLTKTDEYPNEIHHIHPLATSFLEKPSENLKVQRFVNNLTEHPNRQLPYEISSNQVSRESMQKKIVREFVEASTLVEKADVTNNKKFKEYLRQRYDKERVLEESQSKPKKASKQYLEYLNETNKQEKKTLHECSDCKKKFTHISNLNYHKRTHENEHFLLNFFNVSNFTKK